jgi:hypothetical protein
MSLDTKDAIMASSDVEKGSETDDTSPVENGETVIIDPATERSLVWKLDTKMLPLLTLMYLFNSVGIHRCYFLLTDNFFR